MGGVEVQAARAPVVSTPHDSLDAPSRRLRHVPGLDGLRALAVAAVLAYHEGFQRARGGYLGVSSFFTLSGFLIASLLLVDVTNDGRVSFGRFWERRARRLLPAAFATIALIVLLQATEHLWTGSWLRGDILAALGYSANWRFATTNRTYGVLFGQQSPVLHFWSLGIEEQFYLVFPLLFAALVYVFRRRRYRVGGVLGGLALASFATAAVLASRSGNEGFAYYGTHARAGELLIGATLAFIVVAPRFRGLTATRAGQNAIRIGGLVGLAVLAVLWSHLSLSSPKLFHGGVEANALATAAVILACRAGGPVAWLLSLRAIRYVGRISYGIYLYHWPLFQWLTPGRMHVSGQALFIVRVAITVALAAASYHFLEAPIRFGRSWSAPRLAAAFAAAALLIGALVMQVPTQASNAIDLSNATVKEQKRPYLAPGTTYVYVAGDSLAYTAIPGLGHWSKSHPTTPLALGNHEEFGCALSGSATVRLGGVVGPTSPGCTTFVANTTALLRKLRPNTLFVLIGLGDLCDQRFTDGPLADGKWHHLGQPAFDKWELQKIRYAVDSFDAVGVPIVWATFPEIHLKPNPDGNGKTPENNPNRVRTYNALLVNAMRGTHHSRLVDLAGWVRRFQGGEFSPAIRLDGVHFSDSGSDSVAEWLVPQLIQAARGTPNAQPSLGRANP